MKIRILTLLAAAAFFAGCNAPVGNAVKMDGKDDYRLTVLGDIHFDGKAYHIADPDPESMHGAKERNRNIAMWENGSSDALLAAASQQSCKDTPFVIQLGDLTQGDCDNAELQDKAFYDAVARLKQHFPGRKTLSLVGNHDVRGLADAPESADRVFVPLMKAELGVPVEMDGTNYALRYGKDLYIFYDYTIKKRLEENIPEC